jgi:hypothetical protein
MLEVIGYMFVGVFFAMLMPVLKALIEVAIAKLEKHK